MKLRLIETRLLTVKNIVNTFHGKMKEHMRYKADTTPPRSRTQNISLCFLISISAVILKLMLKITSISPVILRSPYKEEEEEEEVPLFTINSFIHITYYSTTR